MCPPSVVVLLRILQKLHDLAKFFLGFVNAGYVAKFHLDVVFRVDFGAAARKRHDAAFGATNTTEEKAPDANQQQERQHPAQDFGKPAAHDLAGELDVLLFELLNQGRILDPCGGERFAPILLVGFEFSANRLRGDRDLGNGPLTQLLLELAVGDGAARRGEQIRLRDGQQEHEPEHVPERRAGTGSPSPPAVSGSSACIRRWRASGCHSSPPYLRGALPHTPARPAYAKASARLAAPPASEP